MAENKKNADRFWIYILECENGNYYTGYTRDLTRRYHQHLAGTASSKYTRSFKPKRIAQCWQLFDEIGIALKIERFIKTQPRRTKEALIIAPQNLRHILLQKLNINLEIQAFDLSNLKE